GWGSSWLAVMWLFRSAPPVAMVLPAALLGLLGVPALRPKRPAVRAAVILCALELVLLALAGLTAILLPSGHPPAAILFLGPLMLLSSALGAVALVLVARGWLDRKSTRLNSSHDQISYAVFCLQTKSGNFRGTGERLIL